MVEKLGNSANKSELEEKAVRTKFIHKGMLDYSPPDEVIFVTCKGVTQRMIF